MAKLVRECTHASALEKWSLQRCCSISEEKREDKDKLKRKHGTHCSHNDQWVTCVGAYHNEIEGTDILSGTVRTKTGKLEPQK